MLLREGLENYHIQSTTGRGVGKRMNHYGLTIPTDCTNHQSVLIDITMRVIAVRAKT